MKRAWGGLLALALVVPALRADEKKADQPKGEPKPAAKVGTPAEQLKALTEEYEKATAEVREKLQKAKVEDRQEIIKEYRNKMATLPKDIYAIAAENPKDPAAVDALVWLCEKAMGSRESQKALDTLVKDHATSDRIAAVFPILEQFPGGEAKLRAVRAKNPNEVVKAQAALSLANVLKSQADGRTGDNVKAKEKEAEALYAEIVDKGKLPEPLLEMAKGNLYELRNLAVGKKIPELESKDLDDKEVKLSALSGKVVVLDVWATWCGPCRAMIPHERELVEKMKDKPFALVSVSCDAEKENLKKFLEKEQMPWTHWFDGQSGPIGKKLNVQYYPTVYVLDAKGVIRFKGVRGEEMDKAVETLLKEIEPAAQK
jgi:thiol-disulfide isomerase/thioredoxin